MGLIFEERRTEQRRDLSKSKRKEKGKKKDPQLTWDQQRKISRLRQRIAEMSRSANGNLKNIETR